MATRETNSRWRATAPAITTTRIGSNETDTNTARMGARIALQDGVTVRRLAGGIADLPPGLAKKYDCRAYTYQGRPYYYFQEPDGRMVVRCPSMEVHGSVDIVH